MGFHFCVTCCFSLAAFNILSLCLIIFSLISMCLGVFLLVQDSLHLFLNLIGYFLFHVGEIFQCSLFKNFLIPFIFLVFWDSYYLNAGAFDIFPEVSETILSSLFCSSELISASLSSSSLIHSSTPDILLLIPSKVF